MKDKFLRNINYMRISITDRCNMRCNYCMPGGIKNFSMNDEILTYEEILEIAKAAVNCGIVNFKITGGEPLVRRGAVDLISRLKNISGVQKVTLTTNGALLSNFIHELKNAGLDGVNISLDSLEPKNFEKITGFNFLEKVLEGIDAAISSGIKTKINTVLQKGINEDEWENILEFAKNNPVHVRFIELMPIGEGKNFHGVKNSDLLKKIQKKYKNIENDFISHGSGPAVYIKIPSFIGGVGFISAVCGKFCASCNRLRLTANGRLKPCLSFADYVDIKEIFENVNENERQKFLENAIKKAMV